MPTAPALAKALVKNPPRRPAQPASEPDRKPLTPPLRDRETVFGIRRLLPETIGSLG